MKFSTAINLMNQWTRCSTTSRSTHLKGRPVHGHVDAVVVAPPLQILLVVGIGNDPLRIQAQVSV
ncbi:hypothetical protein E2C01_005922 [Portunus trituberculatus]|uniref:Uncharacterized protein n=1 Tax=Portunus trituberculatus TaxID=210409 RepID=A0A5B7CUV6_PORTR|nr:hypothetical protein [Portunus trituberculatus]